MKKVSHSIGGGIKVVTSVGIIEEFGIIPFDEFIRKAEIVKVYYIGGTVDYHWRDCEKKNTINLKWTASQIFVMQSILLQIKL